jgi:hypothetical protein
VTSGVPLTVAEVAQLTRFSSWYIREPRKEGKLRAILDAKPYRFHPREVYGMFFALAAPMKETESAPTQAPCSLKIERDESVGRIPAKREDLWRD